MLGLTTPKKLCWKRVPWTPPKSARNIFISLLHNQVTQLPILRAIPWFLNPLTVVATAAASLCRRRVELNCPFGAGPSWQWMQEKKEVEKEKGRGHGHRKMKGDQKRERESLSVGLLTLMAYICWGHIMCFQLCMPETQKAGYITKIISRWVGLQCTH